ncbi:MAG: extracellular solute-binding protein, partial [Acetobacteraceae bacterium]|nr:extracellular solute-binding protein [Acetobacteraceae bacterium]
MADRAAAGWAVATRRRALLGGAAATAGLLAAPAVHAQGPVTLRFLGTAVNQHQGIKDKVREDLGVNLEYIAVTSDDVVRRAVTQPNSFDVMDLELWMARRVLPTGNILGLEAKRIKLAEEITPVLTRGEVGGRKIGDQGLAPWKVLYLEGRESKNFAASPTEWLTLIPTVYNADTLGIRPDRIGRPVESWAELLNPEFRGRASLLNIPAIGIMDAAMAVEAAGRHRYADKGNMTRAEIDVTMAALTEAKRAGQFRAFWRDFNESVNLMASGEVVIQSMWSPAVTKVRSMGVPCVYQPLKEGYRAWSQGMTMPRTTTGRRLDAAYEFINWFLSGWAGAFLNRQGYYSAVLSTAQKHMEPFEWAFWMEGKPAERDIRAPDGTVMEKAGTVRDGGSFEQRMGSVACWNAV